MAVSLQDLMSQEDSFAKQATAQKSAQQSQDALQGGQQPEPSFLQKWVTGPVGRVTTSMLDSAVSAADTMYTQGERKVRDAAAGAVTGATNIADSAVSLAHTSGEAPDANGGFSAEALHSAPSPVWDHAKQHILDFRDAVAVQDPTLSDNLVQGVAQLALPFAGYSRALGALHGVANMVAAGAATDATALGPHDMRMADLLALGRHTEGKLGDALRAMSPDGGAVNAYINYLTDRSSESEAEGRFKNVIDGFGANMIATPLIHGAAVVLKQGTAALRSAVASGVRKFSDLAPPAELPDVSPSGTVRAATGSEASLGPDDKIVSKQTADDIKDPGLTLEGETPKAQPMIADTGTEEKALDQVPAAKQLQQTLLTNAKSSTAAAPNELIEPLLKGMPDTPEGKFYSDILQRLHEKNLQAPVSGFNSYYDKTGVQVAARNYRGLFRLPTASAPHGSVHVYPAALVSPTDTVKTLTHELVHAATSEELNNSPFVNKALEALRSHGKEQFGELGNAMYGFTNTHEFVAEIESNPDFQRAMRRTPMQDGRSVWEHYKDAVAGLLGVGGLALSPMFDRLLSKEKNGA